MTKDEELNQLREENTALRAQVALLSERISVLEAKPAKDSHNSHLPPSSDRFHRQPKSLRKKSGKKPGGQTDHPGSTLQTLVQRCAASLEPVEQQIKAALSHAPVLHQDETGLHVAGQRQWMHVSATERLTHYAVHPKRGKAALDAIGILADFTGVSVHDGWSSYWQLRCLHALCNVHHLRELTFLAEVQQQAWAQEMKELLLESKAAA